MKPDFTQINKIRPGNKKLEMELHTKNKEMEEIQMKIKSELKNMNETLKKLHKKSQRLRKERERIEERVGKELDKIG